MGCIKIESFEETEFSREEFGQNKSAYVNAGDKPAVIYINDNDIAQFEPITVMTPRPGTSENKEDYIDGVRILTHTGNTYVVFADDDLSFSSAFDMSCGGNVLVEYDMTRSDYLRRFKKGVASKSGN